MRLVKHSKNIQISFLILVILAYSLGIWLIPFFNTSSGLISKGIPQYPDALAEIHGAEYLVHYGDFHKGFGVHNVGYVAEPYLKSPSITYPLSQILIANLYWFTGTPTYIISSLLTILLVLLLMICVYTLLRTLLKDNFYPLIALPFLAASNAIIREILWSTPHSLQAQILIIISLWSIWKIHETKEIRWIMFLVLLTFPLIFIHLYSALILILSLFLYSIYYFRNKPKVIGVIVAVFFCIYLLSIYVSPILIGGFGGKFFSFSNFPLELISKYIYPSESPLEYPPLIWDYPYIWGYILTIIGVYGLIKINHKNLQLSRLLLIMFLIPAGLATAHVIGLYFLILKNLFIVWIPLIVGFSFGLKYLICKLNVASFKSLKVLFICSIVIIHTILGVNFIEEENKPTSESIFKVNAGVNFRYPPENFIGAFDWLKENAGNSTILVPVEPGTYFLHWAPILTLKNVSFGSKYLPKKTDLERDSQKTLLGRNIVLKNKYLLIQKNMSLMNSWTRYRNVNHMLTKPSSQEALKLMGEYNIKYILVRENSFYDNILKNTNFEIVYNKAEVKIYAIN